MEKYIDKKAKLTLIAPSFGTTTNPYDIRMLKAMKVLKRYNFDITIGPNVFKNEGVAGSNTPKLRAQEFMDAYESDTDLIVSVGGGETMVEILEYVDFEKIKSLPHKWFMGFSDNTNLTYTLTTMCDVKTIYGINAPSFYIMKYDALDSLKMLKGEKHFEGYKSFQYNKASDDPIAPYNFDKRKKIIPYNYNEPFTGIMLGGCLDCLFGLVGTKFDNTVNYIKSKNEKIIFFLEACDLNSIGIRRALFSLKMAGWFTNVAGFVIGRSLQYYDNSFGTTPHDSYIDLLKEYNVPILLDCDLGHLSPSLPFKTGAKATVKYEKNNIIIDYEE